ncbi:uncharacterized protein CC84DRAFT_1217587 [Paraphaeosphaeria sporulosa]|uniref:Uncharacterized protein n=1 Tax=Paraphaeosphaeria sporulosa TaxID=1460663 RepID=A0A177CHM6_9PLEO|nr:uncharacterized protein CC84DRAFT_1217587 [Paraphaeosphaeria sporulosa]OAG06358.1 hypothetical protein CC84DRAFT_1217587 [Paraphaeosphaeria sporulosa]
MASEDISSLKDYDSLAHKLKRYSTALVDEDTSFLRGYNSLPDELKLKIFGYALCKDASIDQRTAQGLLDGSDRRESSTYYFMLTGLTIDDRDQSLFSTQPSSRESSRMLEAFFASNTFLVDICSSDQSGAMIPPALYRRFVRSLHLYILPLNVALEMLSTFRINTVFVDVRNLAFSVNFR